MTQASELTARQAEILDLIRRTVRDEGRPPTRIEICEAFGFRSPNAAEEHLKALVRKGAISMEEGRARGIRLLEETGLPLIGRVAAGSPILASENCEKRLDIDPSMFSPSADYLLRVKGLSMRDAGILDGDLIAVHRTADARNGQIVVARLGDEVTVKRLEKRGSRIRLLAENADFAPIEPEGEEFALEGVVVGLIRNGVH
ncbi:transcriptional repressor LexA [Niveibacterium sp. 24ML]|uniref:transcriptional repressor LexA n=1 Tax=Niveibacterium sp. 24ML TaxID=2985512 RepID=UPI002270E716|nr:transcriptional repressor LexA [Niveibacterium sp. 24ML]MCX9157023.1 transcriptional repressor LexA [Niveibacterium sp. 24ML]